MTDLLIASNEADAHAVEAVEAHHAQMAGALRVHVDAVLAAARTGAAGSQAKDDLARWCRTELLPHAAGEEQTMYPAAGEISEGRLLIEAMTAEHVVIGALVDDLEASTDPVRSAALAESLWQLFSVHLAKENDLVLPLLARTPGISVAGLLDGMHEILGGHDEAHADEAHAEGGHSCGCHEAETEVPVLDARAVPHAIRHATIFGALDAVPAGGALELVAPHDPLPLLGQIEDRHPGAFSVEYLERGPQAWRLLLTRV